MDLTFGKHLNTMWTLRQRERQGSGLGPYGPPQTAYSTEPNSILGSSLSNMVPDGGQNMTTYHLLLLLRAFLLNSGDIDHENLTDDTISVPAYGTAPSDDIERLELFWGLRSHLRSHLCWMTPSQDDQKISVSAAEPSHCNCYYHIHLWINMEGGFCLICHFYSLHFNGSHEQGVLLHTASGKLRFTTVPFLACDSV